ncbi:MULTISPECIES: porin [Massilia]|uniref:porin n=1 Tax=Massilia TaxID=149698 RepID=UPI00142457A6|nr:MULTISPECIES: porin [unclassified Massilia]MDQ1835198.1 porin [Massilia sp. CCM 9029]MDQ1925122.1 porin [Massilia sp. CCM 9206]NIA00644.1 porin [Massilia sp. CCM 8734]
MNNILACGVLVVATSLTVAAPVLAQSNVTVYGTLDAAIDYNTNVDAQKHSRVWMPNLGGGMMPSRLGFRGTEDLGAGLKAIFTVETGIAIDSGTSGQGNRLFGRQAWVGVRGDWGQVTFGRNYNMLFHSMGEVEIVGPTQYGLGSLDAAIPNSRTDNSVAYKGTFDKVTVGTSYSLGRDVSNAGGPGGTNCPGESAADAQACREWSVLLRYDTPGWGVTSAYDRKNGATGAAAGLTSSNLRDNRLHVAGYVKQGAWRLATGVVRRNNEGSMATPHSHLSYLNGAFKFAPNITVDGIVARLDYKRSANDSTLAMVRAIYDLSARTSTYVALGHMRNGGGASVALSAGGIVGPGLSQNGVITGIKHAF